MSFSRDELLRPTLRGTTVVRAPYSVQAGFLTAFFGGPFAAIAMTAVNSVRLHRLTRDLLPLGLMLVAYIGFAAALTLTPWGAELRAQLTVFAGPRAVTYLHRFIGLLLFGLSYALHRKEQRSADLIGLDRPNGWIAGIACIVAGLILQGALLGALSGEFR
jgi:hypothetical protein